MDIQIMDSNEQICDLILQEYYGENAASLVKAIHKHFPGWNSLSEIHQEAKLLGISKKEANYILRELLSHNLAEFTKANGQYDYQILHQNILLLLKFPRYISHARSKFGEDGHLIIDAMLKDGPISCSHAITNACVKLFLGSEGSTLSAVLATAKTQFDAMKRLAESNYIVRCSVKDEDKNLPLLITEVDLFEIEKEINLRKKDEQFTSRLVYKHRDDGKLWRVNFDRFQVDFRDLEIRNYLSKYSKKFEPVFDLFMEMADTTKCFNSVTKGPANYTLFMLKGIDKTQVERFVKKCKCEELNNLIYEGEPGDYYINLLKAYRVLAENIIENMVETSFGVEGLEIYSTLKEYKVLDREQICEFLGNNLRETTLLLYRLDKDNYVKSLEIPRPGGSSGAKMSHIVFQYNFEYTVRNILDNNLHKQLANSMFHRLKTIEDNNELIEKSKKAEALVFYLEKLEEEKADEMEMEEVRSILETLAISEDEQKKIEKVSNTFDSCKKNERILAKHIDILQMYLHYVILDRKEKRLAEKAKKTKKK